eukprot:7727195-Alexandrium_andersonii.AAC.1
MSGGEPGAPLGLDPEARHPKRSRSPTWQALLQPRAQRQFRQPHPQHLRYWGRVLPRCLSAHL